MRKERECVALATELDIFSYGFSLLVQLVFVKKVADETFINDLLISTFYIKTFVYYYMSI